MYPLGCQNRWISYRVLVVDDHEQLRRLVVAVLGGHARLDVVGDTGSGVEAVRLVGELRPDVVVLDASMPDLGGLDAVPLISEASPDTEVVIFSGAPPAGAGLPAGVLAWLTKGEPMDDTIERLLAALDARRNAGP